MSDRISDPSRERLRGIVSMLFAVMTFAVMDALMKRVSGRYPPLQISSLRFLIALAFLTVPIAYRQSWKELRATQPLLHVFRGCLSVIMLSTFVFAVHRLTLAQTYSLYLCAPLLMTVLSLPLLGERASATSWFAIVIGLGGVLVVLNPSQKGFDGLAALAASVSALCYALSAITLRFLSRTHTTAALIFWVLLLGGIFSAVLAVPGWRPVASTDCIWLASIGLAGAFGQWFITTAFRLAPASIVGPFEYTAMIWAFIIDAVFWAALPSMRLLLGAAIVVASGLLVIREERRVGALALNPANPPA